MQQENRTMLYLTMAAKPTTEPFREKYYSCSSLPAYDEISIREELPEYHEALLGKNRETERTEAWILFLFSMFLTLIFPPMIIVFILLGFIKAVRYGSILGLGVFLVFVGIEDTKIASNFLMYSGMEGANGEITATVCLICILVGYCLVLGAFFGFQDSLEGQ